MNIVQPVEIYLPPPRSSLRIMVSACPVQVLPSFMNEKLTWGNRVLDVAICRFLYTQLLHMEGRKGEGKTTSQYSYALPLS